MTKLGKKPIKAVKECAEEEVSLPYYFICEYCAYLRGGKEFKIANTVSVGKCEYCKDKDVTIIPVRDFYWPKSKSEMKRMAQLKGKKK